jgi:hypothetical protein
MRSFPSASPSDSSPGVNRPWREPRALGRSNGCSTEGARRNPGDPLDPLELGLLLEAAEGLTDLEDDDTPPGEVVAEDGGQDDEAR